MHNAETQSLRRSPIKGNPPPVAISRTEEMLGADVVDRAGRWIGELRDMLVDLHFRRVAYGVVLKTAVSEVRTVLDDHPRQPRFIQTVSRRGYRFIAPTTAISTAVSVPRIHFSGQPSFKSRSETPPLRRDTPDVAFSRKDDVVCAGQNVDALRRELACTYPQPAYATAEEVRYAHELRLQLRARLLRDAAPQVGPWCVGAD